MKKIILYACLTALVCIAVGIICCNRIVTSAAEGKIYDNLSVVPHNRVGLLLGTRPTGRTGLPNPYYVYRIEACVALYRAGKIDRILVSGDNSHSAYDEPTQIRLDLTAAGVPDSIIYLDYAGFRTLDSMVRAKEVFGLTRFTIISQLFHNERALYLAKCKGIDAVGYNARDVELRYWQVRMVVREWLARTKAVLDIHTGKQPHFLGEPIEIR
ncbi:MAG: YdcF family protein [Paludibacteraceae bacterium]|nr:YdcF family protein [Paludibacteraceae bacterium]